MNNLYSTPESEGISPLWKQQDKMNATVNPSENVADRVAHCEMFSLAVESERIGHLLELSRVLVVHEIDFPPELRPQMNQLEGVIVGAAALEREMRDHINALETRLIAEQRHARQS